MEAAFLLSHHRESVSGIPTILRTQSGTRVGMIRIFTEVGCSICIGIPVAGWYNTISKGAIRALLLGLIAFTSGCYGGT
eukprot:1880233-Rhodomonas_salina.4